MGPVGKKYMLLSLMVLIINSIIVLITRSIGLFLICPFILCWIFFGYLNEEGAREREFYEKAEDEAYQKVEDELDRVALNQQSELSLKNVVEVLYGTDKPHFDNEGFRLDNNRRVGYNIKDAGQNITGHIYKQILCAKCGGELRKGWQTWGLRHCPSCGAHARLFLETYAKYVFEGTDGTRKGEIREERGRRFPLAGTRENWLRYDILDAQNQLLATVKTTKTMYSIDLRGYHVGLYDSQDRMLGEYHGDRYGRDYKVVTPDRRVITEVHKEEFPTEYSVYAPSDSLDSHIVLSYVVVMDIISEELMRARTSDSGGCDD